MHKIFLKTSHFTVLYVSVKIYFWVDLGKIQKVASPKTIDLSKIQNAASTKTLDLDKIQKAASPKTFDLLR